MTAKTNLKFDKFQNFACQAQQKMRNNEFCDVTLVSADNNKFAAHKVILTAYSFVFKNMLGNEKHPHPLIFLRGVESKVLGALLDFIYCGEAEIQNDDLGKFIKLSTDIELMGLTAEETKRETDSAKEKKEKEGKACKHWNRGYCKQENCKLMHCNSDCETHLSGRICRNKNCHKRHRTTCKYWYWHEDGCQRKGKCAYLHQETFESRGFCENRSRDRSLKRSESRERGEERRREHRERTKSKDRSKNRSIRGEGNDRGDSRRRRKSIESYRSRSHSTDNNGDREYSRERSENGDYGSRFESRDGEIQRSPKRRSSKERTRSRSSSFDMSRLEEYER